jgi:hypothetical protein
MSIGSTFSYSSEKVKGRNPPWVLAVILYSLPGISHEKKVLETLNLFKPGAIQPMKSPSFPSGITVNWLW